METLMNTSTLPMVEIASRLGRKLLNTVPANKMDKARCAPVGFDTNGEPVFMTEREKKHDDVYSLLGSVVPTEADNYYAVITGGWAAPVDGGDCMPSQHPERRRVELLVLTNRYGFQASAMSMNGDFITDDGQAQGSLALALANIW